MTLGVGVFHAQSVEVIRDRVDGVVITKPESIDDVKPRVLPQPLDAIHRQSVEYRIVNLVDGSVDRGEADLIGCPVGLDQVAESRVSVHQPHDRVVLCLNLALVVAKLGLHLLDELDRDSSPQIREALHVDLDPGLVDHQGLSKLNSIDDLYTRLQCLEKVVTLSVSLCFSNKDFFGPSADDVAGVVEPLIALCGVGSPK